MLNFATGSLSAIIGGVVSIAAVLVGWWWQTRPARLAEKRRRWYEEISRRADAGDADWFNDFLDSRMRRGR